MSAERHTVIGYASRRSVKPGESLQFMISTEAPRFRPDIVRLVHGDRSPAGPGFKEQEAPLSELPTFCRGRKQRTVAGAYLEADGVSPLQAPAWTVAAWVHPTAPAYGVEQGIVSRLSAGAGWVLALAEDGSPLFRAPGCEVRGRVPLQAHIWWLVAACVTEATITLTARPLDRLVRGGGYREVAQGARDSAGRMLIGAVALDDPERPRAGGIGCFNGKIEAPSLIAAASIAGALGSVTDDLHSDPLLHAGWSLGPFRGNVISSCGPHGRDAHAVNLPVGGVTSRLWDGTNHHFADCPDHYSAVEFHANALEDAQWEPDLDVTIPRNFPSGVYALRIRTNSAEDRIPFVVRPVRNSGGDSVAVLLPTLTYLAYANERMLDQGFATSGALGRPPETHPSDDELRRHPEWGISFYDVHPGGVGCHLASWLRPMPNLRPDYRMWLQGAPRGLGADLYLIDWLTVKGISHDVLTDEDLHEEGLPLLSRYNVVLTGSHPEYWTTRMLDAMRDFLATGGRVMYLGGNGFYWVTSMDPDRPHVAEVRRGYAGSRSWDSRPGELHHATTGELGGLWKHRGIPPQSVVGVGFAAQGWDRQAVGYIRTPASHDRRVAFAFEGIAEDEIIGDFGLIMGGAAGDEVDRIDYGLGTPAHALVIATSQPLSEHYLSAVEQISAPIPNVSGADNPDLVHGDMVFFETPCDGAVFSVGSINWLGSLSHNSYDNNVSRLTENVLRRFNTPGSLPQ